MVIVILINLKKIQKPFKQAAITAAFLFFLATSCQRSTVWCIDKHCPWYNKEYHFSKIYLAPTDRVKTIDLEVAKSSSDERVYLNCHLFPIQSKNNIETITYKIGSQKWRGKAYVFEGGQRLWIQEPDAKTIIEALQQDQEVTVSIGMYNETFLPDNFANIYNQ